MGGLILPTARAMGYDLSPASRANGFSSRLRRLRKGFKGLKNGALKAALMAALGKPQGLPLQPPART